MAVPENKVYLGDIGTQIILDTGCALATATVLTIKYTKPDGTEGEWTATVTELTKLLYTTIEDDLDQTGMWKLQAYVEMPDWKGHGETVTMEVYRLMA